jgi:hypothetical protein
MAKEPIIFDFVNGEARRAEQSAVRDLLDALRASMTSMRKPKVVRTVEGLPPDVILQPKK